MRASKPAPGVAADVEKLRALRERRHRLSPGLALKSPAAARAFVREVGMIVQTWDEAMPSLFAAVQGRPYKPGVGGFAEWPEHAWWWGGELGRDGDVLDLKYYRKKTLFVAKPLWPALLCCIHADAERLRPPVGSLEERILRALADVGSARSDLLRRELGVPAAAFTKAKNALEAKGLVIAEGLLIEEGHKHTSVLKRAEEAFPADVRKRAEKLAEATAREAFLLAAIEAAVLAPERKVPGWFPWARADAVGALAALIAARRVARVDGFVASARPA